MTGRQINQVWAWLKQRPGDEPVHLIRALDAHCTGQEIAFADARSTAPVAECLWHDSCALAEEFCL